MNVELFSLLVDTKRLSAAVFRQLEEVPLWTVEQGHDTSLELLGHVRYKVGNIALWALAVRGDRLLRCPLFPRRVSEQEYEKAINSFRKNAESFGPPGDNPWHRWLEAKVLEQKLEDERHVVYTQAEKMVQIFLGLR